MFAKTATDAAPEFAKIDKTVFQQEMTALYMEVFGLAWSHKFKREEFTIPQSLFTKRYLEEHGRLDIWDIMGEYNQAIAISSVTNANVEQMDAISVANKLNKLKSEMLGKWVEANIGNRALTKEDEDNAKCVTRVHNRVGADIRRNDDIAARLLAAKLARCLGFSANLKTATLLLDLGVSIVTLYNIAEKYLKSVSLQI